MKKIYLTGLLSLFGLYSTAQLINEDFASATTTTPPSGWTATDLTSSGVNWTFDDNNFYGFPAPINGMFAILLSGSGGFPEDAVLTSPPFDASALSGVLTLQFDYFFEQSSTSYWAVEVFNGSTWTEVIGGDVSTLSTMHETIDITAAAGSATNAQIRFHWTGMDDLGWAVDNVRIDDITCPAPTGITTSNVTMTGTDLSWTAGGAETNWIVEYGPSGFVPGMGTTLNVTPTPAATLTGLTTDTDYDVYVTADCGSGDMSFAVMSTFSTLCDIDTVTSYPYTQDFEASDVGDLPCGFTQVNVNADAEYWSVTDYYAASGSQSLSISYNSALAMDDYAYTQAFDLTGGTTYLFQVKYAVESDFYPESFEILVDDDQDPAATLADIGTFTDITNTTFLTYTTTYTPLTSGIYYFAVHGNSAADMYNIYIDDITVDIAPSCLPISDLTITDVTQTSVGLTWNYITGQTNWMIEYGPAGFTPGSGTTIPVTTNDTVIGGLSYSSSYDFYVFADCGGGSYSDTLSLLDVATLCGIPAITTYPWTENFDAANLYEMPCGWLQEDNNSDGTLWSVQDFISNSPNNALGISYNFSEDMDDWAITPGFVMSAGVPYRVIYSYATSSTIYQENFSLNVGTAAASSAMTTELADYQNYSNTAFTTDTVLFTPSADGTYYFGFHGYSMADEDMILIDDVTIEESCEPQSADFAYANDTLCKNTGNAIPTITGTTGGYFAADNGLGINPTTGSFSTNTAPSGIYHITYISGFGPCADTLELTVVLSPCGLSLNENMLTGVSVFPNPTSGEFTIELSEGLTDAAYSITDVTGKTVASGRLINEHLKTLDMGAQSTGVYLLHISSDAGSTVQRIVLNK